MLTRKLLRSARTEHFDFRTTVRGEALDELVLAQVLGAFDNGVVRAQAERLDAIFRNAVGSQVRLDGFSTCFGKLLVSGIRTDSVGVAGGEDDVNVVPAKRAIKPFRTACPSSESLALPNAKTASALTVTLAGFFFLAGAAFWHGAMS